MMEAAEQHISRGGFVQRRLPWIIAGAALLVYILTLSRWISPNGLPALVKAAGWSWQPVFVAPLHFILTYPIRWLPIDAQVMGLNLFAAICAALTLGLLARCVAILPHDRTREQRGMERSEHSWLSIPTAWLPPVLAVLVCGLQLTFWEHSVVGTHEALDLLIFAYVIRNLLEYRLDGRESWLKRMALVYGLGMTNNFALVGFLPVLIAALIWIRGLSFFNWRFLGKMSLFGLAGLSLYLFLPAVQVLQGSEQTFLEILRVELGHQKSMLLRFPRWSLLLIGLTSLAPILFMGIKWPASFGDISAVGTTLTNIMMHVIHAIFLIACIAIAFDPQFSARNLVGALGYPMLPFYFLGALSIGYFAGYFLLVFRVSSDATGWRRPSLLRLIASRVIVALLWIALIAVPAALLYKNFPHIRANGRPYLSQLGTHQATVLREASPRGAIVLSDDPYRLYSLGAALRRQPGGEHYVLVDTSSLLWPAYHRYLSRRYPQQWPEPPPTPRGVRNVNPAALVHIITFLSESRDVYYLHPTFGYYMEQFYLKPYKLIYRLQRYPTNSISAPALSPEEIKLQETFWSQFKSQELSPLLAEIKRLRIKEDSNLSLGVAGSIYSRSVNDFAVAVQKSGEIEEATSWFETALDLNPDNPSAYINLEYNRLLRAGKSENPVPSEGLIARMRPYQGNRDAILSGNGPIDEPNVCLWIAESFARGRNFRQAAQLLERTIHFNPNNLSARLAFVSMLNQLQMPDQALAAIAEIRRSFATNLVNAGAHIEMIQAEAFAHLSLKDLPTAEKILLEGQKKHPKQVEPYVMLAEVYNNNSQRTNALNTIENGLQQQPDDVTLLVHYARLKMLDENYKAAIPYLDRALARDSRNPFALLNRAIAHLKCGNLDQAQRDYETLDTLVPDTTPVTYGLHEVYWRKKQRKSAMKYAQRFLKTAPPGSPEVREVSERFAKLKSGSF